MLHLKKIFTTDFAACCIHLAWSQADQDCDMCVNRSPLIICLLGCVICGHTLLGSPGIRPQAGPLPPPAAIPDPSPPRAVSCSGPLPALHSSARPQGFGFPVGPRGPLGYAANKFTYRCGSASCSARAGPRRCCRTRLQPRDLRSARRGHDHSAPAALRVMRGALNSNKKKMLITLCVSVRRARASYCIISNHII